ncbi:MAG TPA: 3-isopropylmalate dehydratase small subunit [Candidatus Limnocylindria bacterium]|jgi:3-isopropylmalate/(R)-2-methylmalate dehydratase small subunit
MKAVRRISGRGMPLPRRDIDTDQIIPSRYLKRVERTGFGEGLFAEWRTDPDFVLNDPRYAAAEVLITGANFGCGSSREHAPWALEDHGFRAIVCERFADIFRGNALKIGLLPVELAPSEVEALLSAVTADPSVTIEIDIASRTLRCGPLVGVFPLDDHAAERLLEGLDDIAITLRSTSEIAAYEARRPTYLPAVAVPER